jgi:hypothetical protein
LLTQPLLRRSVTAQKHVNEANESQYRHIYHSEGELLEAVRQGRESRDRDW